MSEVEPVLEKFEGHRTVNPKALKMDNEIAIFESDLLRLVRDKNSDSKLVKEILYIKIYHKIILRQILENGFQCEVQGEATRCVNRQNLVKTLTFTHKKAIIMS